VSAFTDRQRREDARDAALDRAKAKLRLLQAVTAHFAEGLSAIETAERLDVSWRTVMRYWAMLELSTRRGLNRKPAESAPVDREKVYSHQA